MLCILSDSNSGSLRNFQLPYAKLAVTDSEFVRAGGASDGGAQSRARHCQAGLPRPSSLGDSESYELIYPAPGREPVHIFHPRRLLDFG